MIPFEEKPGLTPTEKAAREVLESNWDNVIRTSPGVMEDFQEKFPKACDLVSEKVRREGVEDLGNVFRPGIPDFLAFDDNGDYCFVEVKGEGDGLRHSQLKWLKDFREIRTEILFTDSNEKVTDKMDAENIEAYSFRSSDRAGEASVQDGKDGFKKVQIPETLSAIVKLEEGDSVQWRLKNRTELILDTK
ncbi:hypothetical protein AQV86_03150 [Nanohaloarchaea archaeon SG9]|nr:hypothetical protein AQV86_03150 [Nanohaloarchaea archaeon SG9]